MTDQIFFDGVRYISATEAGRKTNLSGDYVARLCRDGHIASRRIGKMWYVDESSLDSFLVTNEYNRLKRKDELAKKRSHEYRSYKSKSNFYDGLQETPTQAVHAQMAHALATYIKNAPVGVTDAALRSAPHVSSFVVSPAMDFLHKIVALTLAFTLTFGTYSFVDPQYARFAEDSIRNNVASLVQSFSSPAGLKGQFASAGNLSDAGNYVSDLYRAFHRNVDDLVYSIAFPDSLVRSRAIAGDDSAGSVTVRVEPVSTPTPEISSFTTQNTITPTTQTIINQPIVERVTETQRILAVGGISEDILNTRLQQLDNKLSSQMFSLSSANSTSIVQNYQTIAQTNKIDELNSVTVSNSAIRTSTFSGPSVSTDSLNATNATSSTLFSAIGTFTTGVIDTLTAVTATITNLTATNLVATNSSSTIASAYTAYFGSSATSSFGSDGALTLAAPLATSSGGTGISSYSVGDTLYVNASGILSKLAAGTNNQVLKISGGVPVWGVDVVGSGGGGGGLFATSSDELLMYSTDPTRVLVLGSSAGTSTTGNILEIVGNSLFRGGVTAYSTSTALVFTATSTTRASTFPYASSTALSVSGNAYLGTLSATGNTTLANATTTNIFSTTASSTNLFSQVATLGGLTANTLSLNSTLTATGLATFANGFLSNASSTITSGLFSMLGGASTTNFTASGTGYFGNGIFTNTSGTTTIASGQGFTIGDSQFVLQQGSGNVGIATTTPQSKLTIQGSDATSANSGLNVTDSTGSSLLFVRNNGTVGIGTTNPLSRLTLQFSNSSIVNTNNGASFALLNTDTTANNWSNIKFQVRDTAGTDTSAAAIGVQNTDHTAGAVSGDFNFLTRNAGSALTERLVIKSDGSIGIGTTTPGSILSVQGVGNFVASATSTLYNGLNVPYLNITGTSASSTFANGINLSAGCFSINGTCVGGSGGGGGASLSDANTWTALQLFSAGASTTNFSNFGTAFFGGTATSSFSSAGVLTLASALGISSGGTGTTTQVTNGVNFYDGTKITSGTALTFNGTNLGIGSSTPSAKLAIQANSGETNTTLFSISSSTASATTTLFEVTNAGNVGIGTSTPTNALTVSGGVSIGANYDYTAPSNGLIVQGNVGIGTQSPGAVLDVTRSSTAPTTPVFAIKTPGNTVQFGTVGSATNQASKNAKFHSLAKLDDTHVVDLVSSLYDSNGSGAYVRHVTATIGTYIGKSISWGTPVFLQDTSSSNTEGIDFNSSQSVSAMGSGGKFVAVWTGDNTSQVLIHSMVCTVSGTTPTCGSDQTASSTASMTNNISGEGSTARTSLSVVGLDATNFVLTWTDSTAFRGRAVVGQSAGTTITYGSSAPFSSGAALFQDSVALSSTKFAIAYSEGAATSTGAGTAVVGDVSDTTVSFGTAVTYNNASTTWNSIDVIPGSTNFIVAYRDANNGGSGAANVATVSGSSISGYGTKTYFTVSSSKTVSVGMLDASTAEISFLDQSNTHHGTVVMGTLSGTNLSFGSKVESVATDLSSGGISSVALTSTTFGMAYGPSSTINGVMGSIPTNTSNYNSILFSATSTVTNQGTQNAKFNSTAKLDDTHIVDIASTIYDTDPPNGSYARHVTATVGTYVGNTLSWGTPILLASTGSGGTENQQLQTSQAVSAMGTGGKFVVAWTADNSNQAIQTRVCTVSGTVPTCGTIATASTTGSVTTNISSDTADAKVGLSVVGLDATNFVLTWNDASVFRGQAVVGQSAGTTITYGPKTTFSSGTALYQDSVMLSSTKFAIAYTDNATSTAIGKAIVGDVSGTSLSFGASATYNNASTTWNSIDVIPGQTYGFVVAYRDSNNGGSGAANVGTVTGGTSISYGSKYYFAVSSTDSTSVTMLDASTLAVSFVDLSTTKGASVLGSLSGTTLSFGPKILFADITLSTGGISSSALSATTFGIAYGPSTTVNGKVGSIVSDTTLTKALYVNNLGYIGLNCGDPDNLLEIGGTGTGCNTGTGSYINAGSTAFTANSSREWKENIQTYIAPGILKAIKDTPVRTFDWKPEYCSGSASCTNNLGFIAQEFYPVLQRGDDTHINGQDIMMATWLGLQEVASVFDINDAPTTTPSVYIDANGNLGVGTPPTARLTITGTAGASTTPLLAISYSDASFATSSAFIIDGAGNVGIGTSTPWRTLSISGTVVLDGLTEDFGSGSLCLNASKEVVFNSGSDSCLPSLRSMKRDISNLGVDGIAILKQFQPVSFIYNTDASSTVRYGFIADDTALIDQHLATYDARGNLSGVDDRALISVLVSAMQGINSNLETIASTTATSTPASNSFASSFFNNVFARVASWLADATNSIGDVFARAFHAKEEICVDDQCLSKDDVRALIGLVHASSTTQVADASESIGGGSSSEVVPLPAPVVETPPTETPPIIELVATTTPEITSSATTTEETAPPETSTPAMATTTSLVPETPVETLPETPPEPSAPEVINPTVSP